MRIQEAFCLETQRPAWLRSGKPDDAARLEEEGALQRGLGAAGVLPVSAVGVGEDGSPWLAMPALGQPLSAVLSNRRLARDHALSLALAGVQVLRTLQLAGLELPDADISRFLASDAGHPPNLMLADLSGLCRVQGEPLLGRPAVELCVAFLENVPEDERPQELVEALALKPSLLDLIRILSLVV